MLHLSDRSSEPLHSQISRQLRARILAGELAEGEALSSIRAMAREHRVSVITVQRAYEDLENEGLLYTRRGKGFFVSGLTTKQKDDMAHARFEEAFRPLVSAAMEEGLSLARIQATVDATLEERRKNS